MTAVLGALEAWAIFSDGAGVGFLVAAMLYVGARSDGQPRLK